MKVNCPTSLRQPRNGFNLVELLVVIGIIGILLGLLLPVTRSSRGAALRTDCANRMRQVVLGLHDHHDSQKHFPSAMGDPAFSTFATLDGAERLSGLVLLLPYLDAEKAWKEIASPLTINGEIYPAGPAPWTQGYPMWESGFADFRCPESPTRNSSIAYTSYAFCIGDVARDIYYPAGLRGAFAVGIQSRLGDFVDGTSRTIALAEMTRPFETHGIWGNIAINQPPDILDNPAVWKTLLPEGSDREFLESVPLSSDGRGKRWADGAAEMSLFNTILHPCAPSVAVGGSEMVDGIYSADAYHAAGINVALMDGSVRNVSRDVDAGDSSQPTWTRQQLLTQPDRSTHYGVWGQLGAINDGGVPLNF